MAVPQTIGFPPGYHRGQNVLKMVLQGKTILLHRLIYSLYQATATRSASAIGKTKRAAYDSKEPKTEGTKIWTAYSVYSLSDTEDTALREDCAQQSVNCTLMRDVLLQMSKRLLKC